MESRAGSGKRVRAAKAALALWLLVACADPEIAPPPPAPTQPPPCAAVQRGDDPSAQSPSATPPFWVKGVLVDADDRLVPNTILRFSRPGYSQNARTEPDGRFEFAAQATGERYDVDAVLCDDGRPSRDDRRVHLGDIEVGSDPLRFTISIPRRALAAGTVVDEDGGAPGGFWIEARSASSPFAGPVAQATVDSDARFLLSAWNVVPVRIAVLTSKFGLRRIARQTTDARTGDIRLVLGPPGITGTVALPRGHVAASGVVELRQAGATIGSSPIDEWGEFRFERLDPSLPYELEARVPGHVQLHPYDWCRCGERNIQLRVDDARDLIGGRVLRADGNPPHDTWLNIVPAGARDAKPSDGLTLVRWDGYFATLGSPGAGYDVYLAVNAPDGTPALGPKLGRVRAGDRDVTLRLPR